MARSHTATVLDTDWSPHNDSIVASGGEDGKVMIWKVESSMFEGWGQEGWVPQDFDPVLRIDASPRKIGQVLFHPTASNVIASSSGDYTVSSGILPIQKIHARCFQDTVILFRVWHSTLPGPCWRHIRDRKLRIFDPRVEGRR